MIRNKKKFFLNRSRSNGQRGMGLLEIIMISVVVGIIIYGLAGIMTYYYKEQARIEINDSLTTVFENLKQVLSDQMAWQNTLQANAPGMNCLRLSNDCFAKIASAATNHIEVRDAQNNVFFDSSTGTDGFTLDGQRCTTYNNALGNDACPISFDVLWLPDASGCSAAFCVEPPVRIRIRPKFRPRTLTSTTINTTKLRSGPPGSIAPDDPNIDPQNLDATLIYDKIRTSSGIAEPFVILEQWAGNGDTGSCPANSWTDRSIGLNIENDQFANTSIIAGSKFRIRKAGTFTCNVSAAGFKVGLFKIRLFNETAGQAVGYRNPGALEGVYGIGYANPFGLQDVAQFETSFTISNNNSTLKLQMYCGTASPNFAFGMPVKSAAGAYPSPTALARITCVRNN